MPQLITDLSPEEMALLVDALTQQFAGALKGEAFEICTDGDEEGVQFRCCLVKADRSQVYTMEVRAPVKNFDRREIACSEAVDVLGYVVEQFFSSERDVLPPLDWQSFNLGGGEVFIRGDHRKKLLDEAADLLLAQDAMSRDLDS